MKTIEIFGRNIGRVAIPYVKEFEELDGLLYVYGEKDKVIGIFSVGSWECVQVTHRS